MLFVIARQEKIDEKHHRGYDEEQAPRGRGMGSMYGVCGDGADGDSGGSRVGRGVCGLTREDAGESGHQHHYYHCWRVDRLRLVAARHDDAPAHVGCRGSRGAFAGVGSGYHLVVATGLISMT